MKISIKTIVRRSAVAAVSSVVLLVSSAGFAAASDALPVSATGALSGKVIVADAPVAGIQQVTTLVIDDGEITSFSTLKKSTGVTPNFSVGVGWGTYVYLNTKDQSAIIAGTTVALTGLICSKIKPWCNKATALLAGAAAWIDARGGICNGSKPYIEMWLPPQIILTGVLYKCSVPG